MYPHCFGWFNVTIVECFVVRRLLFLRCMLLYIQQSEEENRTITNCITNSIQMALTLLHSHTDILSYKLSECLTPTRTQAEHVSIQCMTELLWGNSISIHCLWHLKGKPHSLLVSLYVSISVPMSVSLPFLLFLYSWSVLSALSLLLSS